MPDARVARDGPGAARPRRPRRRRRAAPPRDRRRARRARGRRPRGRRGDRDQRRPGRGHAQRLRDRRRRVLAGVGRGGRRAGRPQRLGPGAGGGIGRGALRDRGPGPDPAARPAGDHGPGRGPLLGATPTRAGAGCRATRCWRAAIEHADGRVPGLGRARRRRSSATAARLGGEPWTAGLPQRLAAARGGRGGRASWSGSRRSRATLRTLADDGFDAYYDGDLGERIARGLAAAGGAASPSTTCATTAARGRTPIATTYRGVRVTTHPPNSSGVVALEILNVLERFEPPAGRPLRRPRLVRRRLAPPPARGRQARLRRPRRATSPTRRSATSRWSGCCRREHAAELAARIDPSRADPAPPPGPHARRRHDLPRASSTPRATPSA